MVKMFMYSRRVFRGIFNNSGISLIAVTIIMLITATLALVIASTMSSENISSMTDMQAQQAFYLAQAGLEWYMEELENDSDWSSPPSTVTDQSYGAGTYSVSYANEATDSIDVTATGKVTGWDGNDVQRVITHHAEKSTGGITFADYAIFFGGGDGTYDFYIDKEQTITGDIFVNGDLEIDEDCTITGNVSATGEIEIDEDTNVSGTVTEYVDPPATQPTLTTTYYDDLITTAAGQPAGNRTFEAETISGTEYVNGDVTIDDYIDGSGTIVATGTITINRWTDVGLDAGDEITLIADGILSMGRDGNVGKNETFYSSSLVQIANGVVLGADAGTNEGVVLLSPQDIILKKNITITGFIFGANEVDIDKPNLTLTGNLCGGILTELDDGAVITKDDTKVSHGSIQGFNTGAVVTITISSWQESL